MKDKNDKIVGGLGIKEDHNSDKVSGGLGIKQTKDYGDIKSTTINEDENSNIDINIPNRKTKYESTQVNDNGNVNTTYYKPRRNNKGLIVATSLVFVVIILGGIVIFKIKNDDKPKGDSIVADTIVLKEEEEDVVYDGSGKTTIKEKTEKADTTLTSSEKISIEEMFTDFYEEHIYATNSGDTSYVLNYLTQNGDYRLEYEKLMENHEEMVFDLMEMKVLSIIKQNKNTYMVTVKDKIKVDRPENISIQTCKTVYEVRQLNGEFLVHSIKSETKIKDESKILEIKEPVIEEENTIEPNIEPNIEPENQIIQENLEPTNPDF